jgi:uncharacterized membrane protein YeaQ/YmgE (transglycosylase-associated protein family)
MGIILWIVFGAITGWIASLLMKSDSGLLWDIVVGIVGAVVGGFVMSLLGQGGIQGFNLYSFLVAILGACIFIAVLRAVRR